MNDVVDKIGVVRDHRWKRAPDQVVILESRTRKVVTLGGGKILLVTREELLRLARPGTVFEFVHAFLLAEPRKKKAKGGMYADFLVWLAALEKRGASVSDLDGSVCSKKQRKAFLALVSSDISRSNKSAKSATNGARSKGRPKGDFSPSQLKDAKAIWRNTKDYPAWKDTEAPLKEIVDHNGIEFTPDRAYSLWKGRY